MSATAQNQAVRRAVMDCQERLWTELKVFHRTSAFKRPALVPSNPE